jgi:hypothetical protein
MALHEGGIIWTDQQSAPTGWRCGIFGKVLHDEAFTCQRYSWRGNGWCMKSCQNCINNKGPDVSKDCE